MPTRPTSVTVVAWLLIIIASANLVATLAMTGNPVVLQMARQSALPIWLQYVLQAMGLVVVLVASVGMLKGRGWSRYLYVGWSLAGLLVALATSPMKWLVLPGAVMLAIVTYVLFRAPAARYFAQAGAAR